MIPKLHADFLSRPLAHRALHDVRVGRPENSRAAIRAALEAGYGIEIDLQCSADGHAVVFHDHSLPRLAHAEGPVGGRTAAALGKVMLRGGEEGIPTLRETLELVQGQVPLLIEIKDQHGQMGPTDGRLEASVAGALQTYRGPAAVMSFNPHSTMKMAELAPHIARGLVTSAFKPLVEGLPRTLCKRLREIPDYDAAKCSFISHNRSDLSRPRVADLKARGAHILCWTVKSPRQEAEARKIAENITFEQYLAPFPA